MTRSTFAAGAIFIRGSGGLLLLGEAPSVQGDPLVADGLAGRRLMRMFGVDEETYGSRFSRMNLLPEQRRSEAGRDYDVVVAARSFREVLPIVQEHSVVAMLGRRVKLTVAEVLDSRAIRELKFYQQAQHAGVSYASVPHPSGVNHMWNDPETHRRMSEFCRSIVPC